MRKMKNYFRTTSSDDQGQLVGAREGIYTQAKNNSARNIKIKNENFAEFFFT